ncbi:hypothetical protein VCJ71_03770 [Alteriqipengyuania sp. WL0013]|uniref:hypothetical protein n=1 Tax=Alteriqipengyuania sp. WL0013 TaxID=3110773 RepID=UPI002C911AF5|nr:hypothetical protein [Alteriqipengyuania sp. WL0013]MEB3415179.1 hypothetical protein [Alteriqipengyuania sp. WL0013]
MPTTPASPAETRESALRAIEAAQAWWREAGVDCDFVDEPVDWLAQPEPAAQLPHAVTAPKPVADAPPPTVAIGGNREAWPQSLLAFDSWWLAEPSLAMGSEISRPPPRGPENAPLMILVPQPEAEDRDVLMSGLQGAMLANMVRAMGFAADEVRLGSVLPRHTPGADWARLAEAGLGTLALHHVALAKPKRLLVLGRSILPLLGADPEQAAALDSIRAGDIAVDALAGREPATLLAMAPARRALWHRWLERSTDA